MTKAERKKVSEELDSLAAGLKFGHENRAAELGKALAGYSLPHALAIIDWFRAHGDGEMPTTVAVAERAALIPDPAIQARQPRSDCPECLGTGYRQTFSLWTLERQGWHKQRITREQYEQFAPASGCTTVNYRREIKLDDSRQRVYEGVARCSCG